MTSKYDVRRYQRACRLVRDAAKEVDQIPPIYQKLVNALLRTAVRGTYKACSEIFAPELPIIYSGSDSDYETDKKGLAELESLFE